MELLGGLSWSTAVIPDVTPASAAASPVSSEGKLFSASYEGESETPLAVAVVAETHGGEDLPG